MERRLNCYNFIFAHCNMGKKCPFGHVIVNDKDEYKRMLDFNINQLSERTSPRGSQFINFEYPVESKNYTIRDDSACAIAPTYINCKHCRNLKIIKRKHKRKDYVCKECREKLTHEYINKSVIKGG